MPHCIIEYAQGLAPHADRLLDTIQQTVIDSPLFSAVDVRSRRQAFDGYRLGADNQYFIHVTIKLLRGRSDREKAQLTQQVVDAITNLALGDVLVSCECVDIHTASYHHATTVK